MRQETIDALKAVSEAVRTLAHSVSAMVGTNALEVIFQATNKLDIALVVEEEDAVTKPKSKSKLHGTIIRNKKV